MSRAKWKYCPHCGETLEGQSDELHGICPSCGQKWYKNPRPTASALIIKEGKLLLAKRSVEPEKGKWDLPGGFLKEGEHPEDAVRREVKEELGVDLVNLKFHSFSINPHYEYGQDVYKTLEVNYTANIKAGQDINPASDIDKVEWFDPTKDSPDIAFISIEKMYEDMKKGELSG